MNNNSSELASRTVTIEKVFKVPLNLVWKAWTEANHIAKWWGPKGMDMNIEKHDFKEGGEWKYTMPMPDGNLFISEGQYIEIVPFKRIRTTANFRPMTEGVILEVHLEEKDNDTHFTFNVIHETISYRQQQEKMGIYNGWGSAFTRLDNFLNEHN